MKNTLALVAICGLSAACSALVPRLEAPQLKVVGLNFLGGDQQHQKLRLRIQVNNPNARQIAVRGIDYKVSLADTDFGSLLRVLSAHLGDAALDYRVSGRVHLAEGLLRELPFSGNGLLALH